MAVNRRPLHLIKSQWFQKPLIFPKTKTNLKRLPDAQQTIGRVLQRNDNPLPSLTNYAELDRLLKACTKCDTDQNRFSMPLAIQLAINTGLRFQETTFDGMT
jgi:hypothetical protein